MTLLHPSGVFAAVRKSIADPRTADEVRLPVRVDGEVTLLSPDGAFAALYGPSADEAVGVEVWRSAIRAAQTEGGPYGPWRLLLIWLALPRLSGAVYRVCTRMRAVRADVEAEVVTAFLEVLPSLDPDLPEAATVLLRTARSRAWRYARSLKGLVPVGYIEDLVHDGRHPGADAEEGADGADGAQGRTVEVVRPDGLAGLRAPLRFTVSAERLEGARSGASVARPELGAPLRRSKRPGRGRWTGAVPPRLDGRRP
ncbi:hypothetical protein ACIBEA_32795 [Streptomyces sp. NPDC051555]|uniref:hypothetical protein n=1 Tax=Streptomyces sp. NPDC051555 TaxID=3365657 RepID=UPI0037BA9D92